MTLEMLAAYYSCGCDSVDLFKGCKIESDDNFREHLNRYDVIFLNMQQFLSEAAPGDLCGDRSAVYLPAAALCGQACAGDREGRKGIMVVYR